MIIHLVYETTREITEFNKCIDTEKIMKAYTSKVKADKERDRLEKQLDEDDDDIWYEVHSLKVI